MKEGLVSIVVPVYNVERYIDRCVKSLVAQTYKNIEIILVDDKSPGASPLMCDEWSKKDTRIKVVHKDKNEGLGEARNTGIEYATGEYVCFVDSDDFIEEETIEKVYWLAKSKHADVVHYGLQQIDENNVCKNRIFAKEEKTYINDEIRKNFIPGMVGSRYGTDEAIGLWMSLCTVLISTELINRSGWRCESERNIISEDTYSLLRLFNFVNRAVVMKDIFYNYCINNVSLTHTYKEDRFKRIKEFYDACLKLCEECNYNQELKIGINRRFLSYTIAALKQLMHADIDKSKKYSLIKDIYDDTLLNSILYECKNYNFKLTQKILFWTIKNKQYLVGRLLLNLKN